MKISEKDKKIKIPRILLIGVGKFGKHHLRVLQSLEKKRKIILVGAIVKSKKSQGRIEREYNVPVFTSISVGLLKSVDAVDIVTPYSTHYALVKKCLRYTNVFVEKALADTLGRAEELREEAKKQKKILMVGHIYRFHPVTEKIKSLLSKRKVLPKFVSGEFISTISTYENDEPLLEELHFFDILDYLFGKEPKIAWSNKKNLEIISNLRYSGGMEARYRLAWAQENKIRKIKFDIGKEKISCDFVKGNITIEKGKSKKNVSSPSKSEPLEKELSVFVKVLKGNNVSYSDADVGARIVSIVERLSKSQKKRKPTIAIIGGGVFGTTCALQLGKHFSVTIFERNADILQEASQSNQYRHHMGYHYPRSLETIKEIKDSARDFEETYKSIIISKFPSYYCVSKKESKVTAREFLKACDKLRLPYEHANPGPSFLDSSTVSLCLKTPEAVYNYDTLKNLIKKRINKNTNITLGLKQRVADMKFDRDGNKVIIIYKRGKRVKQKFDYVINTTYIHYNDFCSWLKFSGRPLEFRLKEVIVVKLKKKSPCAVTIMDGPFATLVPTGEKDTYTFGDVPLSIHKIYNFRDKRSLSAMEKEVKKLKSRWPQIQSRCKKWIPAIEDAEYIDSMFVILPVEPSAAGTDARPTDVTPHGFGCWSVFSGKIITCVSAAKTISEEIKTSQSK